MEKVPSWLLWCLFKEQLLSAPSLTAAIGCLHDWCGHISQAVTLSWWGDTLSFSVYEPCLLSPLRGKLKWIEIRKGDPLNLQRQGEESTIHQITCCSEDISGVCSPVPSAEKELSKMEHVEAPHTQQSVPDTVFPFIPQYLAGQSSWSTAFPPTVFPWEGDNNHFPHHLEEIGMSMPGRVTWAELGSSCTHRVTRTRRVEQA